MNKNYTFAIVSILTAFFVMGFVDLVGAISNSVKADFNLSDSISGFFPLMACFWFFILSLPIGLLMNRIGRRNTVLAGLVITAVSLSIPLTSYTLVSMFFTFAVLGIGNTLLQVSLNPLMSNLLSGKRLTSMLTFGQFVKSISSFSGPILVVQTAVRYGDWKYMFGIYLVITIVSILLLTSIKIKDTDREEVKSGFTNYLGLFKEKTILILFIGILCHVGIDIGINVTMPKILMERVGTPLNSALYVTSFYFIFRMVGSLVGAFVLSKYASRLIFRISVVTMLLGIGGLFLFSSQVAIYICVAALGLGNANIFSIIISQALICFPEKKNEISGLMIMGVCGGAIFPLLMGFMSDIVHSQAGALLVLLFCNLYLLYVAVINKRNYD